MTTPPVEAPSLIVRRLEARDLAERREFDLRMYGPGTRQLDDERFTWLYETNPARSDEGYDYWVCEDNGRIVGHEAQIAHYLSINGERHRSVWGIDLMVDPAYRNRTAGPAIATTLFDKFDLGGGLNSSVRGRRMSKTFGVGELGFVDVYIRPLDLRTAAPQGGIPRRLRPVVTAAAPALPAVDRLLGRAAQVAGAHLEAVHRFDRRVDEAWEASWPDYPVLTVRDFEATTWRLDQRPDRDRLFRYFLVRRGHTIGYVAIRHSARTRAMVVVDYLAPVRWVAPLMTLAALEARRMDANALVCKTINAGADRWLRRAGFLKRHQGLDQEMLFTMMCKDERLAPTVLDVRKWLVTSADSDLEPAMAAEHG